MSTALRVPPLALVKNDPAAQPEPPPEPDHFTDVGNAERLVECHGHDLLYCHPWHRWLTWNGRSWTKDQTGAVTKRAKETVQSMYHEAAEIGSRAERAELADHAIHSESLARIKAMVDLAKSELPVLPDDLDRDPWLFNVENGTLDLRTFELHEHRRSDKISKLAPLTHDPLAECPQWMEFLERILPDEDVRSFLQRAIGSSLTGIASDKAMFILWGSGDNGKSVFTETIRELLGDYAVNAPVETFMAKKAGGIPNDVARLKGARFVSAQESEQGRQLNESLVKAMTGGDTMTARFLNAEYFEFRPEFKPFLSTNHRPVVRGTDHGIWTRIKLVPFTVTIPKAEQDRGLRAKLRVELPAILNWALEGCREWQERGLDEPEALREATEGYRQDMDSLKDFLADTCVQGEDQRTLLKALYERYREWCQASGEDPFKKKSLAAELRRRGFAVSKSTGNQTYVSGLALNPVT